jgi:hypothetical protein
MDPGVTDTSDVSLRSTLGPICQHKLDGAMDFRARIGSLVAFS